MLFSPPLFSSCSSSSLLSLCPLFLLYGFLPLLLSLSLSLSTVFALFFFVPCVCSFFPPGFLLLCLCFLSSFVLCVFPPPWSSFFFFSVFAPYLVLWFFLLVRLLPCVMSSRSFSVFCSFSFLYPLVFSLFFPSVSWNFLCSHLPPAFSLLSPRFYPSPLVAFLWLI